MELFGFEVGGIQAWGGLAVILGIIGYVLGKFLTDVNVTLIKAIIYKPC